jgi:hypothetical protein
MKNNANSTNEALTAELIAISKEVTASSSAQDRTQIGFLIVGIIATLAIIFTDGIPINRWLVLVFLIPVFGSVIFLIDAVTQLISLRGDLQKQVALSSHTFSMLQEDLRIAKFQLQEIKEQLMDSKSR